MWDVTGTGGQDVVTYFNGLDFSIYKLFHDTPYQTHRKSLNSAETWLITCYIIFFPLFLISVPLEKGLQILTYTRHSWPLSSEGSLTCHNHCDIGHPFIMVNSEDPWHQLRSVLNWSLLWHPTFRKRGECSDRLHHRRSWLCWNHFNSKTIQIWYFANKFKYTLPIVTNCAHTVVLLALKLCSFLLNFKSMH